jgi:hypothetical protein
MSQELTPEIKRKIHQCWLEATAEICQLHIVDILENVSEEDKEAIRKLNGSIQSLIIEISITIQNAILQKKLLPRESISTVQMYCQRVLWSEQLKDYQEHFNNLVSVVWFILYENFNEIAQLVNDKIKNHLSF